MGSKQKRLRKARRTRTSIATVLHALHDDRIAIDEILRTTPACLKNVSIHVVMCATHNLGPEGVKKCLKRADVWPTDKMKDIPQDAKLRIIECLPPRVRRYESSRSR